MMLMKQWSRRQLTRWVVSMSSGIDRDVAVIANVVTARPLSEAARAKIVEKLVNEVGQPLQVAERIVPSVMGGIRISCSGFVADATVERQLKDMQDTLLLAASKEEV